MKREVADKHFREQVQLAFSERPADVEVLQRPPVSGPALRVVPAVGVGLQRGQGPNPDQISESLLGL